MTAGGLVLGAVDLYSNAYNIEALGTDSGFTLGNAVPITQQLQSFLQYGQVVVNNGWETREVALVVRVKGTGAQMAAAEAALFAEVGKPNLAVYTPPASGSLAMRINVEYSAFEHTPDDIGEVLAGRRVFTIRLTCDAFVYSTTLTTVAALAASGSTTTNVDPGTSTTGWTATVNGGAVSPAVVSGAVTATGGSAMVGTIPVVLTRTGSITTSSTKYLVVDWKIGAGPNLVSFAATGDGIALPVVATAASPTAGYTRTWFFVSAASVAALALTVVTFTPTGPGTAGAVIRSLAVDNIDRTDVRPSLGSVKQQLRTLAITGSAPTVGSLALEHASSALGDAVIYTCPDDGSGYVPCCRNYRVSGPTPTSDATAVSGFYDLLQGTVNNGPTYDIPTTNLPAGEYLVMVRAAGVGGSPATATLIWTYTGRVNGTNVGPLVTTSTVIPTVAGTYGFARLGMAHLPPVDMVPNGASVVRFTIFPTVVTADLVHLDELFLFNMTTGDLTQFACGTGSPAAGGAANRAWVDSAALANQGLGRYLIGFAADRSDAFYPGYSALPSEGIHEFQPPSAKVFTVATNPTTEASASFTYYAAWSNNPAS